MVLTSSTCWRSPGAPESANVPLRLIPGRCVQPPEATCRCVFLGIVLFQPEQPVNHVHRMLHDVLHLGLRYVRVFGFSRASRALLSRMHIFDGAVTERDCDKALGFSRQL